MNDDVIIAIGLCIKTLYGEPNSRNIVICLGEVRAHDQHEFISCKDEATLLRTFADLIKSSDADVIVGYNTTGFDWAYIKQRIDLLSLENMCDYSRVHNLQCEPTRNEVASGAMGDNVLC